MKYIKTYENIFDFFKKPKVKEKELPKVGDFFMCKSSNTNINDFLSQNIGQCVELLSGFYIIKYENIPKEIENTANFINDYKWNGGVPYPLFYAMAENVIDWSPNKNNLQLYIDTEK